MAEAESSKLTLEGKSSDGLPDIYCNPCYEIDGDVFEADGFCQDCIEHLCLDCFTSHRKVKQFRSHQLLNSSDMPSVKPKPKPKIVNTENCIHHQSENIHSYCKSCDQLCCKICLTINHLGCKIEKLSVIAANVKHSEELKNLNRKLDILKMGYLDNHNQAEKQPAEIENYYREAINDMKKTQEDLTKLLAKTEKQAELIKAEDLQKVELITSTCEILEDQIDNIKSSLNIEDNENEAVFISMKRAESQLKSFEDRLVKVNTDNTIHHYSFEADEKLKSLEGIEFLGKLSFFNQKPNPGETPLHVEDIDIQTCATCTFLLPNQQLLITDMSNMLKLIDIKSNKVIATLEVNAYDIAKVKQKEFATTCPNDEKIKFLKVIPKSIRQIREISVNGDCYGIAYNDKDRTLIVTYNDHSKVEIMDLSGTVIRSFHKDVNGARLFDKPFHVALSVDKTMMYISDNLLNAVIMMTLQGQIKGVYRDSGLKSAGGICLNKSGTLYVCSESNTVHQIRPHSDKLELLLDEKDGLEYPKTISYCDIEGKIYVGQFDSNVIKVFKMR